MDGQGYIQYQMQRLSREQMLAVQAEISLFRKMGFKPDELECVVFQEKDGSLSRPQIRPKERAT